MRIVIAGGDGFCGWATALHLSARGHEIVLLDNLIRRRWDEELGTQSLVPIAEVDERISAWQERSGLTLPFELVDLTEWDAVLDVIERVGPEAVVHFGEQSSAPYSMIDAAHAASTQVNNVVGTLNLLFALRAAAPDCHLVKLGTMGEYGTPNIDIEEGYLLVEHRGRRDLLPYPKQPGSFYHLSKVHDSHNILFACRAWGLRATDLNQGVVYNPQTGDTGADPRLANRFDYDAIFGTALNRFCAQAALGVPLTVYGSGGQTRAFIDLRDTVRCVELAVAHPAEPGELRVFNQFTEQWSIGELARRVRSAAASLGLEAEIAHVENPRVEAESHYYHACNRGLLELGLEPHLLSEDTIAGALSLALRHRDRIRAETLMPTVDWRSGGRALTPATSGVAA
ncbi:MAG TPA: NAD-dependent epimerase/dehydratase family protein [Solirubrobacteraceae bacterium]|nr:NAD-dependent epimerase/dehydratase family protein [Solirubrobacteraceae bacterium]